jgi:hypothetical protein
VDETAGLLIAVVEAGEERGLGRVPAPDDGQSLIDHLAVAIEDSRLRARAQVLAQAEAELDCGPNGWADKRVAAQLAEESAEQLQRLEAEDREPTVDEQNALNFLAILQGTLNGQDLGVKIELFD